MKRLAYFEITGELLLDFMKKISDLPITAQLIRVESAPSRNYPRNEPSNIMRFIVEDGDFAELLEGCLIPRIEPICKSG